MDTIINGSMIKWARARASLSQQELADKLSVTLDKIQKWEQGEEPISMAKAKSLAKYALVPLGLLFAENPVEDKLPIPDFRSIRNNMIKKPSPELLEVIYDAQEKQDWYKEYLINEGYESLDFVGSIKISDTPVKVSHKINNILNIGEDEFWLDRKNWEESLSLLIHKIEDAGVLFIRNGIVRNNTHRSLDVGEFRGFVLNDNMAPLIFINGKDAKSAQMFTLIHEFVHVLLGESALLDAPMETTSHSSKVEKFCNQAAAEFLTPRNVFVEKWNNHSSADENINIISNYFKVSHLVVISRAFQLDCIDWNTMQFLKQQEIKRLEEIDRRKSPGGNFFESLKFRISPIIAQAVISEVNSGKLLYRDAYHLLGVKNLRGLNELSHKVGVLA